MNNSLTESLLDNVQKKPLEHIHVLLMSLCMCSSMVGTVTLSLSQFYGSAYMLIIGYVFEGISFALYPLNLRNFPPRIVIVVWSATGCASAMIAEFIMYKTLPSMRVLCGFAISVMGVFLVT